MKINDAFRFNAEPCKCGKAFSVSAAYTARAAGPFALDTGLFKLDFLWEDSAGKVYADYSGGGLWFVCACGRRRIALRVIGKVNRHKECNSKCRASIGFQCECSCGGRMHGAGHEVHA